MMLIKNATIVTQNEKRQILKNGAIFVRNGLIEDIGPSKKLAAKYKKTKIVDAKGMVAMPGLINCHNHAAMALLRGFADDMPLIEWLQTKIWPREAKMDGKEVFKGTELACREMIASGTTTFANMYWYPHDEMKGIKKTGMRDVLGITAMNAGNINFGPKELKELYEKLEAKADEKIKIALAPHSIYTVSEETLRWCHDFAQKKDLLLHIHVSETQTEVNECLKKHGCRPFEYLDRIGFLGQNVLAAHACWLSDKEIKIMAEKGVSIAHCPTSNLKLASGIMPLSKLIRAGVNVCLGTDGPSSNNCLDMFWEMKTAALVHKWNEKDPKAADAQTILDLATINGAKALHLDKKLGSLEKGKEADIILLDFSKPHLSPCYSEISHIIYAAKGSDVRAVFIGGQALL